MEQNQEFKYKTKKGEIGTAVFTRMYTFKNKEYHLCKVNGKARLISEKQLVKE